MGEKKLEWPLIYITKWAVSTDRNIASHSRLLESILCVRSVVFFPGLGVIQSLGGLLPSVAAHRLRWCVPSLLERLILCHLCDCMHQTSQSAFSVIGIRKDKKNLLLHVSSCIRCALFWGSYVVLKNLHRSCLLAHVDVIISLRAQAEEWSVHTGSPKTLNCLLLPFHLVGYQWCHTR